MKTPVTISGNTEIDTTEVDRLFRLKSGGDMLEHKIFKNIRDVSIGMGTFEVIRKALRRMDQPIKHDKTLVVVIGDGNYPRTSGVIAFRTKWRVISVMPRYDPTNNAKHYTAMHPALIIVNSFSGEYMRNLASGSSGFTRLIIVSTDGKAAARKILKPALEMLSVIEHGFEDIIVFSAEELYPGSKKMDGAAFGEYGLTWVGSENNWKMWQRKCEFDIYIAGKRES